jgi:hypothetical protein
MSGWRDPDQVADVLSAALLNPATRPGFPRLHLLLRDHRGLMIGRPLIGGGPTWWGRSLDAVVILTAQEIRLSLALPYLLPAASAGAALIARMVRVDPPAAEDVPQIYAMVDAGTIMEHPTAATFPAALGVTCDGAVAVALSESDGTLTCDQQPQGPLTDAMTGLWASLHAWQD